MQLKKRVSCGTCQKWFYYYDKYWTKEEALKNALILKIKAKARGDKVRTYIEEVQEMGDMFELFLPTTKWYLWIND